MKFVFSIILICASAFAVGPGSTGSWQSFGGTEGSAPQMTVLESDTYHMLVEVTLPGFWLYDRPAEGTAWSCVELPGCFPQGLVGLPDLPSVVELFALPFGTGAVVTVEEVSSTTYQNMEILPRQTPDIDMEHAPFPFVISDEFYQGGESYPFAPVDIDTEGIWAGLNVARLVVNPFSYNPSTGNLEVVSSITLRVDFEGDAAQLSDPVIASMALEMERTVINWDVFEAAATSSGGSRDDGVEYVFICTANTVDWVTELFETHHYLGLHVRVEVLPASGNTTTDVRNAIVNNYTSGVTRFACIVGTHADLPSYNYGSYYGDFYYTLMDAGNYPDLAVGRLTGNQAQIELQVSKIINGYMDYSFDDSYETGIIPSEAVLAAHGEQYPLKYTQCCNEIAAYPYSLCNMTFTKVYPPEGGTAADVSNAINNNIGTITYRGHGDVTYWSWAPGWNASNINALTNTFMPPAFNFACLCGEYVPSGTCLAEAWAWATNGASGNLSAYDPSYTIPNHDHIKQIYIALYDTGLFRVGEAHNAGASYIVANHGSIGITNAKMYLWFGDPAMDIWTFDTASEPGVLSLAAPASVNPGTQNITVTVTDGGSPVDGVNVTLTDGVDMDDAMSCYEEGTTNASGQAVINVTVPATGIMHVGAFLHDYNYDIGEIIIGTGTAGSEGPSAALSLDRPYPNPVTENASLGFSVPFSGNVEITVYDVSGRMVETILSGSVESGSHSVTWAPGSEIASGVYFIRLTTDGGVLTQQAMVIR